MFRRLSGSLPKDPVFPADLEALGHFYPLEFKKLVANDLSVTLSMKRTKSGRLRTPIKNSTISSPKMNESMICSEKRSTVSGFSSPPLPLTDASSKVVFAKTSAPA